MGAPFIKSSPPAVVLICGVKIRSCGDVEFAATKNPCPGAISSGVKSPVEPVL